MRKGFTLIEMMIVVAIIAIIAAIAIPSLLAARRGSLETNSIGSCRAYASAQSMYHRNDWDGDADLEYATPFTLLNTQADGAGQPIQLIDSAFAAAAGAGTPKHGYNFQDLGSIATVPIDWVNDFGLCGLPATYGRSGYRTFIVSTNATVFALDQGAAGGFVGDYPANPSAVVPPWVIAE